MSLPQIEIIVIASIVAVSCSLVGVFLVLRKMSMMSDAITHTVLLGIVLAFFVTQDLSSPLLMIGAALMGIVTVYLIEALQRTRLLSEEASIGVVFPFIFSIAIVLISRYAGSIHLDTDAVLLGELAFAPLDRIFFFGASIPAAYISSTLVLILNLSVIVIFFKELKLSSFDAILAATLGFSPVILNYVLMTLVSITAVAAFNAVGSILVIAFMIGPPVTAYLLTHDLKRMMILSALISVINVFAGYQVARFFDVSIAGSMAVVTGLSFVTVFLFSPQEGYLTRKLKNSRQKTAFAQTLLLLYFLEHENDPGFLELEHLHQKFNWSDHVIHRILNKLEAESLIYVAEEKVILLDKGRTHALQQQEELYDR